MLKQKAEVIAVHSDAILVQSQIKTSCSSCAAKSSCATGTVAASMAPRYSQLTVPLVAPFSSDSVSVGDHVIIAVAEQLVVRTALYVYLLPVISFIVSISFAQFLWPQLSELWLAVVGFAASYLSLRWAKRRLAQQEQQQLLCHSEHSIVLLSVLPRELSTVEPE